tara:strand:+ start:253 stop:675 length:423 start_codon:yes stop_codon:yes gene_type:complete
MSLVTGVVSFFANKFLGSKDSGDDERAYRARERKKEATIGFVESEWEKILQQTKDANRRVDTKSVDLPKLSTHDFLLRVSEPLERRKMMAMENLKNLQARFARNNYPYLEKYDAYEQHIGLKNIAQTFSVEEDTKESADV